MAEGGSSILAKGHDEVFDYNCSQCEVDSKFVEAVAFCPECPMFFCRTCLALHARFLVTKEHGVLDDTRMDEWGVVRRGPRSGTECDEHSGQMITMFCGDHDALCCSVCVSLDHRTCKQMSFIPHVAKGKAQSESILQTQARIDAFLDDVHQAVTTKTHDKEGLERSRSRVLESVANLKKAIIDEFERLEEKLRKKIDAISRPFMDEIGSDLRTCGRMEEALQESKTSLLNSASKTEADMFIDMKRCQKQLQEYEESMKKALTPIKPRLAFMENSSLLQNIAEAANIGEIEVTTDKTNKSYTVTDEDIKRIKLPEDTNTCYIDGMCQLPNGQIIVTDKTNKRIKLLDAHYNVERYHDVPDKPYAVCCTGETEIVTALKNKSLHFMTIGEVISTKKTIKLDHDCFGLAYHDGKLLVSDLESRVYVYGVSGRRLRVLQKDVSEFDLFAASRHIAVSANGNRIYVTDKEKGLNILDREYRHTSTIKSSSLKGTRGVCLDPYGNVFVICCLSHKVMQLHNAVDKIIATVVKPKNGLHYPGIALFDRVRGRLLVANSPKAGCDYLNVYKLEQA